MTRRVGLDRAELISTGAAVVISSVLYVRWGDAYLARGVLGDLIGLAILVLVLTWRRRRLRHEALFCLGCIGAVLVVHPGWPLQIPAVVWWSAVTLAVAAYVTVRNHLLG